MSSSSNNRFQADSALYLKRRLVKDALARHAVGVGGVSVIIAILLIFFYLLYVVFPMFEGAEAEAESSYSLPQPADGDTVHLAMEEQAEIGVRFTGTGQVVFFRLADGATIRSDSLPIPAGVQVTSFAAGDDNKAFVAYGLSDGTALVVRHAYQSSFEGDSRSITPTLKYPLGEEPIKVDPLGKPLLKLAVQSGDEEATLIAGTEDGRLVMTYFVKEESFLGDEMTIEQFSSQIPYNAPIARLLLDQEQRKLYVTNGKGELSYFDVSDKEAPELVQRLRIVEQDQTVTSMRFLAGGVSLIVGDSSGRLTQWFPVRDERNNKTLTQIRQFHEQRGSIEMIAPEFGRKGFLAADHKGKVGIYHATAERVLLVAKVSQASVAQLAVAPRANAMLLQDKDGKLHFWRIHNEFPEISWSALWGEVWYESYDKPGYIWQSTSATNDFEPKYSLVPISFGTLKAAFYAMLIAMPLAILGAMYTAYFMSPKMRGLVKPSIEIMEALPTVILGFLAGLWLAPFMEKNMPGMFSLMLILPLGVILCAYLWQHAPRRLRHAVPEGWEAALLLPVIAVLTWIAIAASPALENWLFGGNMRGWLTNTMGIDFDQRNSLVVGIAMGFAVIPTIFSIAEDAVFGVPRHLSHGSLALGATPWQTMWRVVLLTASPGIFSAVMIGFGRAVGETMIVLMATGNTPVMDFSIFQGMRTLSANIAVEMPESEVGSTHYRVLFLAALVLFAFTFVFNTLAELVRQRLRKKYSSL